MSNTRWRYGTSMIWNVSNVTIMERVDKRTGKIGAKIYVNDPDWRTKLNVNIPCIFDSIEQLVAIGQAFSNAAVVLYGEVPGPDRSVPIPDGVSNA